MSVRRVPDVSDRENFRLVPAWNGAFTGIRRDPVKPVPVDTIVLKAFRVAGYDQDCDGSLMARLEEIDDEGSPTGWEQNCIGLHPSTTWMVDDLSDLP